MTPDRCRGGFTLIEVLVALLVFSILGFAVTSRVGDIVNQTFTIERRTVAHWVTDNYLTRLRISNELTADVMPTGRSQERLFMAGREWRLGNRGGRYGTPLDASGGSGHLRGGG